MTLTFLSSTWVNALSLLLAIAGIVLSIFFYRRSIKLKRPIYEIESTTIIDKLNSKYTKLRVLYGDDVIETFTVSLIYFWNQGRETVEKRDVAETDPIAVKLTGPGKILDKQVLFQSTSANSTKVSDLSVGQSIIIDFDFYGFMQGMIAQIIHTGRGDDLRFSGTIKGAGSVRRVRRRNDGEIFGITILGFVLCLSVTGAMAALLGLMLSSVFPEISSWIYLAVAAPGFIATLPAVIYLDNRLRRTFAEELDAAARSRSMQ